MKTRSLFLSALITGLLLCAGIACFNASSGPWFQGRPADAWLRDLGSADHGVRSQAAVAVTRLGEDGLPAIRRLLRGEGDWFPAPVRQLAEDCLSLRLPGLSAPELRSCGAVACSLLGPDAAPLLPELLRLLEDKPEAAPAYALAALGRPAVEPLIRELSMLHAIEAGDPQAAGRLLPLVYEELRKLAAYRMANEREGQTLQPTALVHEAWLKIAGDGDKPFANRKHFFKAAALAMQQILIDIARRKLRLKRGANPVGEELHESRLATVLPAEEVLAVNDALAGLALEEPEVAEVVRLPYFVGLTVPEIAAALDLAPRTVKRHWAYARAWLKHTIRAAFTGPADPTHP
jgi:RNA polymerase sigma factor (TIGR02999 family)